MLTKYSRHAWQTVGRHRLYSLINISGLAVGIAACLLIALYVWHELSYDRFFADHERIYRISRDYVELDSRGLPLDERHPAGMNAPAGPMLLEDFDQVEAFTRLTGGTAAIWRDNTPVEEAAFMFADGSMFDVFSFEWLGGNPELALREPYSLVLTQSVAEKYFPDSDALGNTLRFGGNGGLPLRITGVIADPPDNTHLPIRGLISLNSLTELFGAQMLRRWNSDPDFHTYIKLAPGASIDELQAAFPDFLVRHAGTEAATTGGISAMNITDIHLHSHRTGELAPPGKPQQVLVLGLIALGILAIACINYVNLATARSSMRGREVGVRKALGAQRRQILFQFLGESLLMTLVAALLALGMVELTLPWFQGFTGKALGLSYSEEPLIFLALLFLILLVGLAAGSFPAFLLSSFQAAKALRGEHKHGWKGILFRQGLVVLQFSIAITLVIATAVMTAQMRFVSQYDLGLDRRNLVLFSSSDFAGLGEQWESMKQRLLAEPDILSVSNSHYVPFSPLQDTLILRMGNEGQGQSRSINFTAVGFDYFRTYGIGLLAGRTFMAERGTDRVRLPDPAQPGSRLSGSFVINAELAREFGWTPEEAVGRLLWVDFGDADPINIPVIGVVEGSHFEALDIAVRPMVFFMAPPNFGLYTSLQHGALRITGRNIEQTLSRVQAVWDEFQPQVAMHMRLLDTDFEALYLPERKQQQMLAGFALLAITIACLGLFGLASHNAERRTKEIGVRKVVGGGVWQIVLLLTNDFSKLVLLSNLLAWPVAYVAMQRWLEAFAYHVDLTPLVFIGSGLIALCIAWVTVGGTAAKAASAKPVLALRYE